jgi:hypothetical protein
MGSELGRDCEVAPRDLAKPLTQLSEVARDVTEAGGSLQKRDSQWRRLRYGLTARCDHLMKPFSRNHSLATASGAVIPTTKPRLALSLTAEPRSCSFT